MCESFWSDPVHVELEMITKSYQLSFENINILIGSGLRYSCFGTNTNIMLKNFAFWSDPAYIIIVLIQRFLNNNCFGADVFENIHFCPVYITIVLELLFSKIFTFHQIRFTSQLFYSSCRFRKYSLLIRPGFRKYLLLIGSGLHHNCFGAAMFEIFTGINTGTGIVPVSLPFHPVPARGTQKYR